MRGWYTRIGWAQSDLMDRLFVQNLTTHNNENLHNSVKIAKLGWSFCQVLDKPSKMPKDFYQGGKNSPNLVRLVERQNVSLVWDVSFEQKVCSTCAWWWVMSERMCMTVLEQESLVDRIRCLQWRMTINSRRGNWAFFYHVRLKESHHEAL